MSAKAEKFDPYHKWLGIPVEEQPPHHYRLLGIGLYEADGDVIEGAADRQMAHVQTHKTGPHSALSQKLLNELSAAKLCLLNAKKKAAYDQELRARLEAAAPAIPVAQVISDEPEPIAPLPGVVALGAPTRGGAAFAYRQAQKRKQQTMTVAAVVGLLVVGIGALGAWKLLGGGDEPVVASSNGGAAGNAGGSNATGDASATSRDDQPLTGGGNATNGDDRRPAGEPRDGSSAHRETNRQIASGNGSRHSDPTPGGNVQPTGNPANSSTNSGDASPPPARLDRPIDLLALVDPRRDQVAGQWKLEGGKLTSPNVPFARLRIGFDPPEEYLLRLEVKRRTGNESLNIGFPWGGSHGMVVIDGWNGSVSGLERINGQLGDRNVTTRRGTKFLTGQEPHTVTLAVRKSSVRVDCDDKLVLEFRGSPGALSHTKEWSVGAGPKLFVGNYTGSFEFTRIEIAPVGPEDARVASANPPTMPRDKPAAGGDDEPDDNQRGDLSSLVNGPSKKTPIPDDAEIESARISIAKTFEDQINQAKTDEKRADLANELFRSGIDPSEKLPTRYVLLQMARDYAAQSGQTELALNSIKELAKQFAVDPVRLKAESLAVALKKPQPTTDHKALTDLLLELTDEAVETGDFESADRLAGLAKTEAARSRDIDARKAATDKDKLVQRLLREQKSVDEATLTLASTPDDPAANLTLGRFYCFLRDDWEQGVKYLFKSGDDGLTALAERELSSPEESAEQIALADMWWDQVDKAPAIDKEACRVRARYWYQQALPGLVGVNKTRAEERLSDGDTATASSDAGGTTPVDLLLKRLAVAFKRDNFQSTNIVGRGRQDDAFRDMPGEAGLLIGFNVTLRQRQNIRTIGSLQAIFLTAAGERTGPIHGRRDRDPVVAVKAPPGYAVAALLIKPNNNYRLDGLMVSFAKITPTGLSKKDFEQGDELGVTAGGAVLAPPPGKAIVGIFGSSDDFDPDALGLIYAP
jgi:hypothetical protein